MCAASGEGSLPLRTSCGSCPSCGHVSVSKIIHWYLLRSEVFTASFFQVEDSSVASYVKRFLWGISFKNFSNFFFLNWSVINMQYCTSFRYTAYLFESSINYSVLTMVSVVTTCHRMMLLQYLLVTLPCAILFISGTYLVFDWKFECLNPLHLFHSLPPTYLRSGSHQLSRFKICSSLFFCSVF